MLEDYLPENARYDTSVPTPKAVMGIEVGERHYRHDQILHYLSVLAASSKRAKLLDYGITHEGRRLVLLFISSAENINKLNELSTDKSILKVWNGFSVHGNEASGANASVLYAYHLVAGYSAEIDKILNEALIIIDPTINPDGYDRFVTDVNSMRGIIDNPDSNDSSHQEQNPNGRTNHYWFDLNRDWLLLSQVESRARIKQFHKWQPHVLGDHHEMGSHKTFFFQPGVPDRTNPLIPQKNIEFTNKLGKFHAKTLTEKGMSFYTKESYDDFYPGKGSTYPDLQGSVGILFEQASAKGGKLKTKEGIRSLIDGVDNQFRTAMSTLTGAFALKQELLKYKIDFFQDALETAKKQTFKGYVLDFKDDLIKAQKMADFLSLHNIKVSQIKKSITVNKHKFAARTSLYIPLVQPQYTLIKSLFSTQTSFKDNTFYDVSSWNIGMAWGVTSAKIKYEPELQAVSWKKTHNNYGKQAVAYAFNWNDGNAAAALNYLQQRDISTQVTSKTFSLKLNGKSIVFQPGAIIIPALESEEDKILAAIANIAEFFQVSTYALANGLNKTGIDLGSPAITTINKPKPLLLIGDGINSYQAGSIWYLFDTEVGLPLTKITKVQLQKLDLHNYTHLLLPSGDYKSLSEETEQKIIAWVKQGGHLISLQKAASWSEQKIQKLDKAEKDKPDSKTTKPYADFEQDLAENTIGGAIVSATADLTHPLAFGMRLQQQHALIKGNSFLLPAKNPYATPLKADAQALAAGYISTEKLKTVNNSSLIIAETMGKGSVIKFGFNPSFRGFWLGTQKWLVNAVYFAPLIKKTKI
ncbi:Secreted protein containing N-terminal Zinc-dependent carboxypeptidase related domain [hydrothermal vent metagenome]|uniref:Secreted protein containing N-terminal Zinc-dependent carboxypeptidase related domain n=1 Tax=hydrothermal vent metagenome TaxID=652676 RepID=A0A3B0VB50_9ZZZZ